MWWSKRRLRRGDRLLSPHLLGRGLQLANCLLGLLLRRLVACRLLRRLVACRLTTTISLAMARLLLRHPTAILLATTRLLLRHRLATRLLLRHPPGREQAG